jgi:predicted amidohydrolase YtcJ
MAKDPILKDHFVALQSHDAHAFWVSPKVLASINVPKEDVEGGKIFRYPDGTPTGVFMDNARELINIPTPSDTILSKRWKLTVEAFFAQGFVSVHDALLHDDTIEFFYK